MNILMKFFLLIFLVSYSALNAKTFRHLPVDRKLSSLEKDYVTTRFSVKGTKGEMKVEIHARNVDLVYVKNAKKTLLEHAPKILNYFEHVPEEVVHFIVEPNKTQANGWATIFPTNVINLIDYAPSRSGHLNAHYDFNKGLILHELVHVVHLSMVNGFLGFVDSMMGSVSKLSNGVVPRWFTEGIATWAETKFTEAGRLRNEQLVYEVENFVARPDFCKDLACIDNPGKYPKGSSSYWVGASFIDFMERRKPGTAACLVRANSDNIPFFLNSAFTECTGMSAMGNFFAFKSEMMARVDKRRKVLKSKKFLKNLTPMQLKEGDSVLSKNFEIVGDDLYTLVDYGRVKRVVTKNLKTQKETKKRYDYFIDEILPPTAFDQTQKEAPISMFSFVDMRASRVYEWGDEKEKPKENYSHAFRLSDKKTLYLKYKHQAWHLYFSHNKISPSRASYSLPQGMALQYPRIAEIAGKNYLVYQSYLNGNYALEAIGLNRLTPNAKRKVLHYEKTPFRLVNSCDNSFIISKGQYAFGETKKYYELKWQKSITKSQLRSPLLNQAIDWRWNKKNTVYLLKDDPGTLYTSNKGCQKQIASWKKTNTKSDSIKLKQAATKEVKKVNLQTESYPGFRHFLPHFWFPKFSISSDSANYVGFQTSLSDPMGNHTFSLDPKYYTSLEEIGPNVSYNYRLGDRSSCLFGCYNFLVSFNQDYDESSFSTTSDKEEDLSAAIIYQTKFGSWSNAYFLSATKSKERDFLGSRDSYDYTLGTKLVFPGRFYDDFFRALTWDFDITYYDNQTSRKQFYGLETRADARFQIMDEVWLKTVGSFGKLDKNTFGDGVIFGGGTNTTHELYGIGSNDTYGNTIYTFRGEIDYHLKDDYSDSSLFALYTRRWSLVTGWNMLHTDVLLVDDKLSFDEKVTSLYGGIRSKMTLFYLLPLDADLLMAKVDAPTSSYTTFVINFGTSTEF